MHVCRYVNKIGIIVKINEDNLPSRFAIQSNGAENMVLSPQTMLSCNLRQQQGCGGGNIDVAWNFAGTHG
ncbi:hypothetical protein MSG28_013824 [Choristoneura fumiferana]|uniref:Uncharacterized protein n=1 Tax=Choristoneura fumiferana TaxID=7141 RepID=A0ACC0K958_CHOFU|nr:hypothetical protein MSG28_013824 [Choristoneura fumiferana]